MRKLLYGIGGLIALLLLVGLLLPRQIRFEIEREIDAPPATVFALLNDWRRTRLWSRAAEIDPNATVDYAGPARGAGATMSWDGAIAGSGTQTIVESRPHEYIETVINGGEPGEARSVFELSAQDGGTRLAFRFEHDHGFNLVGRYAGPFLARILRREQEQSLAKLEDVAESLPPADFSELVIERIRVDAKQVAFKSVQSAPDATSISRALGAAYFDILNFIDANALRTAGSPLSIARDFSGSRLKFDAGIPVSGVSETTPRESDGVRLGRSHAGTVLRVRHTGPYRTLSETHRKIAAYLAALDIERTGDAWESYVSDPAEVPEAELLTYVYYPVRDEP